MDATQRRIGELECSVVDSPNTENEFRAAVVICHGFGAPGTDLVPIGPEMIRSHPKELSAVRFVFPIAPIELEPGGFYDSRAWWPIDMLKLQQMMEHGELRDLRRDRPELLDERFRQIEELIRLVRDETGLTNQQIVLGGFSQGAMLATEVSLRLDESPGALIVWSGTLLSEDEWRKGAPVRRGMPVVQTHGRQDPILPFAGAELLRDMLTESGLEVDFAPFNGPHTVSTEGIRLAAQLIGRVACGSE